MHSKNEMWLRSLEPLMWCPLVQGGNEYLLQIADNRSVRKFARTVIAGGWEESIEQDDVVLDCTQSLDARA
eukprot:m.886216 g.886216  ORF g.886216 m.886216 type:complete len:71 (-) comp23624_c0_seq16:1130-1342(-)